MAASNLSYWDYLKAAFHLKTPIAGLGHLPLNKLFFFGLAVFGIVNLGFLALAVGLETAYLLILADNPRFRKWVQAGRMAEVQGELSNRQSLYFAQIPPAARERYRALETCCNAIIQRAESASGPDGGREIRAGGLNQLLWIFLRLLVTQANIQRVLNQTPRAKVEKEIADLQRQMAGKNEDSAVYRSLKGTCDIQQRRLENLLKAEENLQITEAELQRIEKQIDLISEETTVSGSPDLLSVRLDGIMDSLQGTTRWMSEHSELFQGVGDAALKSDLPPMPPPTLKE